MIITLLGFAVIGILAAAAWPLSGGRYILVMFCVAALCFLKGAS